jgi:hypothetical protein
LAPSQMGIPKRRGTMRHQICLIRIDIGF